MTDRSQDAIIAEIGANLKNFKEHLDTILGNQEHIFLEQNRQGKVIEAIKGDVNTIKETNVLKFEAVKKGLEKFESDVESKCGSVEEKVEKNTNFRNKLEGMAWILQKTPVIAVLSLLVAIAGVVVAVVKN